MQIRQRFAKTNFLRLAQDICIAHEKKKIPYKTTSRSEKQSIRRVPDYFLRACSIFSIRSLIFHS